MKTELPKSKVALYPDGSYAMACRTDKLNRSFEKDFTYLSNNGLSVLVEEMSETQERNFKPFEK